MATREEIQRVYNVKGLGVALEKYTEPDDRFQLLEISASEGDNKWQYAEIIERLPKGLEYDDRKLEIIDKYHHLFWDFHVRIIFTSLASSKLKIDLLGKMISLISEEGMEVLNTELLISDTLYSLKCDNFKVEIFRKYISYFDGKTFSDYISYLHDYELRTREFETFKGQFPDFDFAKLAIHLNKGENVITFFDQYLVKSKNKKDKVCDLIKMLNHNEPLKRDVINRYIKYFNSQSEVANVVASVKDDRIFLDLVKQYVDRIGKTIGYWQLKSRFKSIKEDNDRLEAAYFLYGKAPFHDVIEVMCNITSYTNKIDFLNEHRNELSSRDLRTILLSVNCKDKPRFINEFADLLDKNFFHNIIQTGVFSKELLLKHSDVLSKVIDFLDVEYFCILIPQKEGNGKRETTKFLNTLNYLLSCTNNQKTKRSICNAALLNSEDSYVYENYDFLTDEEKETVEQLLSENKYLFKTFMFALLDIPYLKKNMYFLRKLSLHPEISMKLTRLSSSDPKKFALLLRFIKLIYTYDINHDVLINDLLEGFDSNVMEIKDAAKLSNQDLKMALYILLNGNYASDSKYAKKFGSGSVTLNKEYLRNYFAETEAKLDTLCQNTKVASILRYYVLFKLFGLNKSQAEELLKRYGVSMDKYQDNEVIDYLKLINVIINEKSVDTLRFIYGNIRPLTYEERYLFSFRLSQVFNKTISDSLYKVNESDLANYYRFEGQYIPCYKPSGDFFILMNSICAYCNSRKPHDFYSFWNNNDNTTNHGICCSLISNQNVLQTAPIKDVIFGFDSFSSSAILLEDSDDLASENNDYVSRSRFQIRYMNPEDLVDNTRHTHNEIVLERKELRDIDQKESNIQPNYVIIYDDFNSSRIRRSAKAAIQFGIPIVYLDSSAILKNEEEIIEDYRQELIETLDLDILKKLIVRFENYAHNISWRISDDIVDEMAFYLNSLLKKVYENAADGLIDINYAMNFLLRFIELLQDEEKKHAHRFDKSYSKTQYIKKAEKKLRQLRYIRRQQYQRTKEDNK